MKRLTVVLLTSSYPRSPDDTAAVFLREMANHLHARGIRVHVLAPAGETSGVRAENGIIVQRVSYFPSRWRGLAYGSGILSNVAQRPLLWLQVPFFIAAMTIATIRLVGRVRPDVVHAHWVLPQGFMALIARKIHGTPVIVSAHGGDAFALKSELLVMAKRFCLRRSDAWTSNTRLTSGAFGSPGSLPEPKIVPMGVDVEMFAAGDGATLRAELPEDHYLILFVGRLVEKKGVDDLIKAFALLPDELRSTTALWIVGTGERERQLREMTADLGVGDRVTFRGTIPNSRLPDYYAAADLFVGPSVIAASGDQEGQGVVFLEAFAARLCVLATRSGGIEDVVEHEQTGVLVEPRRPEELAREMSRMLTDPNARDRLADNAYRKVSATYSWPKIAGDLAHIYQDIRRGA